MQSTTLHLHVVANQLLLRLLLKDDVLQLNTLAGISEINEISDIQHVFMIAEHEITIPTGTTVLLHEGR